MKLRFITSLLAFSLIGSLYAQPRGLSKGGTDTIDLQLEGNKLTVHSVGRAVLNWEDFTINQKEHTHFEQSGKNPALLSRVQGKNPARILGKLSSNAPFYLVSKGGIIIGEKGRIEVPSFVGSTLDIEDNQFLKGENMNFLGSSIGAFINQGTISSKEGSVSIISHQIVNKGLIEANSVECAAGFDILLKPENKDRIFIRPRRLAGDNLLDIGIDNEGAINALAIDIQADGNLYKHAIHLKGSIDALTPEKVGGRVLLRSEKGAINIKSTINSESITASATTVHLHKEAHLKGKEVCIKGEKSIVEPEAIIDVSANQIGNGGNIFVEGSQWLRFYGKALATAGALEGDGGKVTLSSDDFPLFTSGVDTSAPNGHAGIFTLASNFMQIGPYTFIAPPEENMKLCPIESAKNAVSAYSISRSLEKNNVVLKTTDPEGSLSILYPLIWDNKNKESGTLTLDSKGDLFVKKEIIASGFGGIHLLGKNVTLNSNSEYRSSLIANLGSISINSKERTTISGSSREKGSVELKGKEIAISSAYFNMTNSGSKAVIKVPLGSLSIFSSQKADFDSGLITAHQLNINASNVDVNNCKIHSTNGGIIHANNLLVLRRNGTITADSGDLFLRSTHTMHLQEGSHVHLNGSGKLTLASDFHSGKACSNSGKLVIDPHVHLMGPGNVALYSAGRGFNTINSPINGESFVWKRKKGNIEKEQWGTHFGDGAEKKDSAFTFFYKNGLHPSVRFIPFLSVLVHKSHNPHIENLTGKIESVRLLNKMDILNKLSEKREQEDELSLDKETEESLKELGNFYLEVADKKKARLIYETLFKNKASDDSYFYTLAHLIAEDTEN